MILVELWWLRINPNLIESTNRSYENVLFNVNFAWYLARKDRSIVEQRKYILNVMDCVALEMEIIRIRTDSHNLLQFGIQNMFRVIVIGILTFMV